MDVKSKAGKRTRPWGVPCKYRDEAPHPAAIIAKGTLKYRYAWLAFALLLAACGRSPDPADKGVGEAQPSLVEFEQSAFLRKHPAQAREERVDGVAYRFDDSYGESRVVTVTLAPPVGPIRTISVAWDSEGAAAAWSSIKKQFLADLLESTFSDVDYGQVSSYVMEQQQRDSQHPARIEPVPIGDVRTLVRMAGPELMLTLERPPAGVLQRKVR